MAKRRKIVETVEEKEIVDPSPGDVATTDSPPAESSPEVVELAQVDADVTAAFELASAADALAPDELDTPPAAESERVLVPTLTWDDSAAVNDPVESTAWFEPSPEDGPAVETLPDFEAVTARFAEPTTDLTAEPEPELPIETAPEPPVEPEPEPAPVEPPPPDPAQLLELFALRADTQAQRAEAAELALSQAREVIVGYEANMVEIDARFRDEAVFTEQHRLRAEALEAALHDARLATATANDNRLAADHHAALLADELAATRRTRDKALAQLEAVREGGLFQVVMKKDGQSRRLLILAADVVNAAVRARAEGVESDAIENMSRVADRVVL